MRVLWTHNFDQRVLNKGVFVDITAKSLRERGVDLQLEYLGNLRSPLQMRRAKKHLRRIAGSFDLVHAQFGSACALVTSAIEGMPKVLSIRGSDWNAHSASLGFLYLHTRIASRMTRAAAGSFDRLLPVSQRIATELAAVTPGARIDVLPSPVDLARFTPRDRKAAKALLGFPVCDEKWVLFNANDPENPIKRFALAKSAFEIAHRRHGNLRLRLATGIPHDEMPLHVAACDLILCTSDNEGWPNSVKEALACDVPFVATDVSDLSAIAQEEAGCRVCAADPAEIADNICGVLAGPAPTGLRRHVEGMSVERNCDRLIAIYEDVIKES